MGKRGSGRNRTVQNTHSAHVGIVISVQNNMLNVLLATSESVCVVRCALASLMLPVWAGDSSDAYAIDFPSLCSSRFLHILCLHMWRYWENQYKVMKPFVPSQRIRSKYRLRTVWARRALDRLVLHSRAHTRIVIYAQSIQPEVVPPRGACHTIVRWRRSRLRWGRDPE